MSHENHKWDIGTELPKIRPHSLAKHRVIEQYLRRYVEVLTSDLRIPELRLTLVDGFAGGGLYEDELTGDERYGSPLIMLRAMKESARIAQSKRSKDFLLDAEYVFVENSRPTFECLQANLRASEFSKLIDDKIRLINDRFDARSQEIIDYVANRGRGGRAIFLLDQFGYTDVPFSAIRSILSKLDKAEVILTFATDSLIDYISELDVMQQTLQRLGLSISKEDIRAAKQEREWRRAIQLLLHQQIFNSSGAKYYTPFFIRSKDAHRDYWLIHLSNHSRARDVMVELHWLENTSFAHFGRPGLLMLGYDQDDDTSITRQGFFPEFRFDETAQVATKTSLLAELPERIAPHKSGISFKDLFALLTNETPATSEHIKVVLAQLRAEGAIVIRDSAGLVTRESGVQQPTDVIRPSDQKTFIFNY